MPTLQAPAAMKVTAEHLRQIAARYPAVKYPRVVLVIDNAPWHAGEPIRRALADNPHLELKRLPSYSPQLNVIERFWKVLRRRATHYAPANIHTCACAATSITVFQ